MDKRNNFQSNAYPYENHLSIFGQKVLNFMVKKWESDQNRAQESQQSRFESSIRNGRVLQFRDENNFGPLPALGRDDDVGERSHLGGGGGDRSVDFDSRGCTSSVAPSTARADRGETGGNDSEAVGWDSMFDLESGSEMADLGSAASETRVTRGPPARPSERGSRAVRRAASTARIGRRERKYAKTVRSWLADVDPNNPVDGDGAPAGAAPGRRAVQARLANRGGVMTFERPSPTDIELDAEKLGGDEVDSSDQVLDGNSVGV